MVNARISYGRARPAAPSLSTTTPTNLSNVPSTVQSPKHDDQSLPPSSSTTSSEQTITEATIPHPSPGQPLPPPPNHIPSEHDYTSFRQPQPRIRQPSIRRVQYIPTEGSVPFQPRGGSTTTTTFYRQRYPVNPRARVITIPTNQVIRAGARPPQAPRTISVQTNGGLNGQNQAGAPIYVNGGKQIYLKGIDIGSIANVHHGKKGMTELGKNYGQKNRF